MSGRGPLAAFAALAVATVGAFFVTQHLKVSTPLIAGFPRPTPEFIAPLGHGCGGSHRATRLSFYLLHRADDVAVYIVDGSGSIVRTLATGRHMRRKVRFPDGNFGWNGRTDSGAVAPDGTYYYRIALLRQGRTIELKDPVVVKDHPPQPRVVSVTPSLLPAADGRSAAIRLRGNEGRDGLVRMYRSDLSGGLRPVKVFRAALASGEARWDGRIGRRPAPAGTYLIGLQVRDAACNLGRFPALLPPPPGSTPGAGVSVRYLAAEPPLSPVPAGAPATVLVDSRRHPYSWILADAAGGRPLARGRSAAVALRLTLPRAGLYVLSLRSGSHRTAVPLVASTAEANARPRVLVVLPALSWQGANPVDDDGDGLPDTLAAGRPIRLARVLSGGLPAGLGDEAALLGWLERSHRPYELTTDVALAQGQGPALGSRTGVVLAGSERWLPAALAATLTRYAQGGGHVLSLGLDSLRSTAVLRGGEALAPSPPAPVDVLGARPSALRPARGLITVGQDRLGLFGGTAGAFSGWRQVQTFAPGPGVRFLSTAITADGAAAVAGFRLGQGLAVEVGLPGLAQRAGRDVGASELLAALWRVMSR